jgi:hypothetical protein
MYHGTGEAKLRERRACVSGPRRHATTPAFQGYEAPAVASREQAPLARRARRRRGAARLPHPCLPPQCVRATDYDKFLTTPPQAHTPLSFCDLGSRAAGARAGGSPSTCFHGRSDISQTPCCRPCDRRHCCGHGAAAARQAAACHWPGSNHSRPALFQGRVAARQPASGAPPRPRRIAAAGPVSCARRQRRPGSAPGCTRSASPARSSLHQLHALNAALPLPAPHPRSRRQPARALHASWRLMPPSPLTTNIAPARSWRATSS